jgi:ABC-2 type transport system ATP-binding protein
MLELVKLSDRAHSKVKTFSHGMKQRLGIAQALVHDPELIILDEPTTGLDPQGMKEVRELILHLSKEKGKTIFLSSHILKEIEETASRLIIINKGTVQVEGETAALLKSENHSVTFEIDNGHFEKALQYDWQDDHVQKKVLHFIVIAYIRYIYIFYINYSFQTRSFECKITK